MSSTTERFGLNTRQELYLNIRVSEIRRHGGELIQGMA